MKYYLGKQQTGFSLIEIMIALALSAGLLTGIVQVFTGSRTNYQLDNAVSETQESGNFALEQLADTLRYRGFQGCAGSHTNNKATLYKPISSDFIIRDLWKESLLGYEVNSSSNLSITPSLNDVLDTTGSTFRDKLVVGTAAILSNPTPAPNSDIVSIYHGSLAVASVNGNMANKTAPLSVDARTGNNTITNWTAGEPVIVGNCSTTALFTISAFTNSPATGAPTSYLLEHTKDDQPDPTKAKNTTDDLPIFALPTPSAPSAVRRAWVDVFYVADTGRRSTAQGRPSIFGLFLSRNGGSPVEVTSGIEYMGIQYGEVFDDGKKIQYLNAHEVTDFRSVQSVRIGVLAVSDEPVLKTPDIRTYSLPGLDIASTANPQNSGTGISTSITYDASDLRLRKTFVTTVYLKNAVDYTTSGS